jgi:hypothetical protein
LKNILTDSSGGEEGGEMSKSCVFQVQMWQFQSLDFRDSLELCNREEGAEKRNPVLTPCIVVYQPGEDDLHERQTG